MNMKKFFLYALIPAFIAGFFSLAPKIYDVIIAPKFNLNYEIQSGALVEEETGKKRAIVSVKIENMGTQIINDVEGFLAIKNFEIEAMSVEDSNNLNPKLLKRSDRSVQVTVKSIYPGQRINISLLIKGSDSIIDPRFTLRSKEGLGVLKADEKNSKYLELDLKSSISTFISVFIMFLFGIFNIAKGRSPFPFLRVISGKSDMIFFILTRSGFYELAISLEKKGLGTTYLATSDLITGFAINNPAYKLNAVKSLKSMLCIKDIAEGSKKVIRSNLKYLDVTITDSMISEIENNSISLYDENNLELREKIIKFLE